MTEVPNYEYSQETLRSVLQLACILDDLKTRIRTGWLIWRVRAKRLESVAEHCYSCLILANLLYPIYPGRESIDMSIVNLMLIFHEIGETLIGDVPVIDKRRHRVKDKAEHRAWKRLLKGLPYEQQVYDLLMHFDEGDTPEAQYAKHIDKLDAPKTMKRYYDAHKFHRLGWCVEHCKMVRNNDDIQSLIARGAKTPVDIWFADEYAEYINDSFFMDVHKILREMNTNIKPEDIAA